MTKTRLDSGQLRAKVSELEASIAALKQALLRESAIRHALEEENARCKGVLRRLLGHFNGIESSVKGALESIERVEPLAPEGVEIAGRHVPVVLASTDMYSVMLGHRPRPDSIWHGMTPNRRTRLRRIVLAEPSDGCMFEGVELMGPHSDEPLLAGPIPAENLTEPVDVSVVIAQKSPLVLTLSGKARSVALVFEDAP